MSISRFSIRKAITGRRWRASLKKLECLAGLFMLAALLPIGLPIAQADTATPRAALLDIVESFPVSPASLRAIRSLVEQAPSAQIGELDRGLYFEAIGDDKVARRHYERAAAALNSDKPGKDTWCIAYRLLRVPDELADRTHPAVKERFERHRRLDIPVIAGDLEKVATTARIQELWNALPPSGPVRNRPVAREPQSDRASVRACRPRVCAR